MHKILLFLLPFLFLACSSDSSSSDALNSRTTDYPYSTDYDISQEATKQHRMLVIRLDYPNQYFVNGESSWADKIFGTQNHQLNHYMNEVSNGQFQYSPVAEGGDANNGVVTVYFTTEHPDPNVNYPNQYHPDLTAAITAVYDYGFDFSLYDDNGNGELTPDELLIIFIMAGEEDAYSGGTSTNGIWAHQWCTDPQYTPTVNGVSIMGCNEDGNYAIFGERHYDSFTDSHDATVGIIAHELGHSALNLPDLYDVTYNSAGIGYFGLMSSGTWGQVDIYDYPGQTPVHFSAWSKTATGWVIPEIATGNSIDINATGDSNYNIVKVPISDTEYFLLENRSTIGYDSGLSYTLNGTYVGGLAIWHIDKNIFSEIVTCDNITMTREECNLVNNEVAHKGVDLEEASDPELDTLIYYPAYNQYGPAPGHANSLYYSTNIDTFSHTTSPNSDSYSSTSDTGIIINNISDIEMTMTVDITNPN